ncbi:hypothetical protein [Nostoc sp.]
MGKIAHNVTAVFQASLPNTLKLTDRSERKGAIATISARKLEEWGNEGMREWGDEGDGLFSNAQCPMPNAQCLKVISHFSYPRKGLHSIATLNS